MSQDITRLYVLWLLLGSHVMFCFMFIILIPSNVYEMWDGSNDRVSLMVYIDKSPVCKSHMGPNRYCGPELTGYSGCLTHIGP